MERASRIAIQGIVAGARQIAITIDQHVVDCQKPQGIIDIEQLRQLLKPRSLVGFVERPTKTCQGLPIFVIDATLRAVGALVLLGVFAEKLQPCPPAEIR